MGEVVEHELGYSRALILRNGQGGINVHYSSSNLVFNPQKNSQPVERLQIILDQNGVSGIPLFAEHSITPIIEYRSDYHSEKSDNGMIAPEGKALVIGDLDARVIGLLKNISDERIISLLKIIIKGF